MTQSKEQFVKVGTLLTLLGMLAAAIIMHFHGIETAINKSRDHAIEIVGFEHNLREKDIQSLREKDTEHKIAIDQLKKNFEDLSKNKRQF